MRGAVTVLRTLLFGAAGGMLFTALGLPLPWLTGPIVVTALQAIAGVEVRMPAWFRPVIFVALGITIGAQVNQQLLDEIGRWPLSLAFLVLYVPVAIAVMYAYFRLVARDDPNTALLGSTPGSFAYVMAYATASGADVRKVVVTQSVRLGILVLLLPLAVTRDGAAPLPLPLDETVAAPADLVFLIALAAAGGGLLARLARLPAAPLLGALAVSALLHGTGLNTAALPGQAITAAQVALGCLIGSRLNGADRTTLARVSLVGLGAVVLSIALSALFAAAVSTLLGIGFSQALLAFAPGAIEAMALMAVSLDLDPAYVGAHHIVRVLLMPAMIPLCARLLVPAGPRPGSVNSD